MEPHPRFRLLILIALIFLCGASLESNAQPHHWSTDDLFEQDFGYFPQGRRPVRLISIPYAKLLASDVGYVFASPWRWKQSDWIEVGAFAGSIALSATLDSTLQPRVQLARTPARDAFTENAQRFGEDYSFLVLGGFEVAGLFLKDPRAKAVAMDGLTASLISAGMITPALKKMVGRARPYKASGPFDFSTFSDQYSFPSGHTTQAFAVATVIAEHYEQWWVKILSYGVAASVGYSRIHHDRHYLSDVVAGAIIGHVVGRTIVRRHSRFNDDEAGRWSPVVSSEWTGLTWAKRF